MPETRRYLGIELAGAKNQKTTLAVIEFYPKEKKTFLLEIFDRIANRENQTNDEALLEIIQEMSSFHSKVGVNVPLELPPCITCTRKKCPLPTHCTVPVVKWMREFSLKKDFTPYTQRPIELWIRYQVLPRLAGNTLFEVDETLGGSRAPLTARMNFLKRHLEDLTLFEVWPKLTMEILISQLKIEKRIANHYRKLEDGAHAREEILTQLAKDNEIFIYERDFKKLSLNLASFDAFICAFTVLMADQKQCVKIPKGFPTASGWVNYPQLD